MAYYNYLTAKSNLALIQIQGVVVGGLASIFALLVGWLPQLKFDLAQALLLSTSSILTASMASFCLGVIMIGVIIASRHLNIDPDNVATPIAASLGDLVTLAILAESSKNLNSLENSSLFLPQITCPLLIILGYLVLIVPFCIELAKKCESTKELLKNGWTPGNFFIMLKIHQKKALLDFFSVICNGDFQFRWNHPEPNHRQVSQSSIIPTCDQWSCWKLGWGPS